VKPAASSFRWWSTRSGSAGRRRRRKRHGTGAAARLAASCAARWPTSWRIGLTFRFQSNLRDHFFASIDALSTTASYTQWVNNGVTRTKVFVQNTKRYEAEGLPLKAEGEGAIKKLFRL